MITKICSKCKEEKLEMAFSNKSRWCKPCINENSKKCYLKNREKRLQQCRRYEIANKDKIAKRRKVSDSRRHLKNRDRIDKNKSKGRALLKYWPGATWQVALANYLRMVEGQDYRCAICQKHESEFKKRLSVDHSHKSGRVRAALCWRCNRLYVAQHTVETAKAVYEYLLKYDV